MNRYTTSVCTALVALVFFFTACSPKAEQLDPKTFGEQIKAPGAQILDVRTPDEFAKVHLNGAKNFNWNDQNQFKGVSTALDKKKPVYLYCLSGARSSEAAAWMRKDGFGEVYELQGGLFAWRQAGLPIEDLTPDMKPDTARPVVAKTDTTKTPVKIDPSAATPENLPQLIKGDVPVLVDFNATWCGPCKLLRPSVDAAVEERKDHLIFISVDTDNYPALATSYNITALPTLILFRNGKILWRSVGLIDQTAVETGIDSHL